MRSRVPGVLILVSSIWPSMCKSLHTITHTSLSLSYSLSLSHSLSHSFVCDRHTDTPTYTRTHIWQNLEDIQNGAISAPAKIPLLALSHRQSHGTFPCAVSKHLHVRSYIPTQSHTEQRLEDPTRSAGMPTGTPPCARSRHPALSQPPWRASRG